MASNSTLSQVPKLRKSGRHFIDELGRTIILHGINLVNKHPPKGEISFTGRPFPLSEAAEHLGRIQILGFNSIRLVVPWESLEPYKRGHYDEEYLTYLFDLISLLPQYGIMCYIDVHQDVWSRVLGGSGAPEWTLDVAGFDVDNLKSSGAIDKNDPTPPFRGEKDTRPPKLWPAYSNRLAPATMSTLFFAGETFAPKRVMTVDGETQNIGLYLRESMMDAYTYLMKKLSTCENIIGIDLFNEPHKGFIELINPYSFDFMTDLAIGPFPSFLQSCALGSGYPQQIDVYKQSFPVTAKSHQIILTPSAPAWKKKCIWKEEGVWKWDAKKKEAKILRSDYFSKDPITGRKIDFYDDFYFPFVQEFSKRISAVNPTWFALIEPIANEFMPSLSPPSNMVYSPHFYDLDSLFSQVVSHVYSFNVQLLSRGGFLWDGMYFGKNGRKKNYSKQIGNIVNKGYEALGEIPIIIGEIGLPFDVNKRVGMRTGNWNASEMQYDAILSALETHMIGYNLWNYNPHNTYGTGDDWNFEDFSIYSLSSRKNLKWNGQGVELYDGIRVLEAIERPRAMKIAGIPTFVNYNMQTKIYNLQFCNPISSSSSTSPISPNSSQPPLNREAIQSRLTEIHLPRRIYESAFLEGRLIVDCIDGTWEYDPKAQRLSITHTNDEPGFTHKVTISIKQNARFRIENIGMLLIIVAFLLHRFL